MLITERAGRLRILNKGTLSEPVKGTPKVHEQQDGGMFDARGPPAVREERLDLSRVLGSTSGVRGAAPAPAPPPAQQAPGRGRGPAIPSMTVVVRGKISNDLQWTDEQVIFRGPAELYTPSGSHFGSRLIFDRAGHLFYTIGERGAMQDAQDLTKPTGKIHRVNDDGTVPKDNPFVSQPGSVPTIWSYGHRNPEGLAWDPVTGLLWESEHGPTGGDEINVIERGHNYGWSVATKGTQNGVNKTSEPGMDDPIVYYTPTLAPAGIAFYTGDRYPAWKNTSLFVTGLAGQQLRRLEIKGRQVVDQEVVFNQLGRVRDIVQGPDGYLYVALQNPTGAGTGFGLAASTPGMIIRLMPVKADAPPNTAKSHEPCTHRRVDHRRHRRAEHRHERSSSVEGAGQHLAAGEEGDRKVAGAHARRGAADVLDAARVPCGARRGRADDRVAHHDRLRSGWPPLGARDARLSP